LKIIPPIDLAETPLDLIFDVFCKEGNGVLGSCSRMGAVGDRGFNNVPLPIGTAVHRNSLLPSLHGWHKQMYLGKRLRMH
jgi:hypothetical protein